jgi:hypothetical protein
VVQVVADSSALIHLHEDRAARPAAGPVWRSRSPSAVAQEVKRSLPELPPSIRVFTLSQPIPPAIAQRSLGAGESETMALALERRVPRIILDDLEARRFGRSLGLEAVGTGAVLYKAVGAWADPGCASAPRRAASLGLPLEPRRLPRALEGRGRARGVRNQPA